MPNQPDNCERLNKVLARCGVGSRRTADLIIDAGRVSVNGQVVDQMGVKVAPGSDRVEVDGRHVTPADSQVIIMLNKPRGVISTARDRHAPKTLEPWLDRFGPRLHPVGRLDRDSEGLLLLTNDGELTLALTHPRFHLEKEYRVSVRGELTGERARLLTQGVELDDGPTAPAVVSDIRIASGKTRFTLILREGRNRQIRRMCEAVGLRVVRLSRRRIGPLTMSRMQAGEARPLTANETRALRAAVRRSTEPLKD